MSDSFDNIKVEQYIRVEKKSSGGNGNNEPNSPKWLIYLMPIFITLVAVLFYNIGASKFKSTDTKEREEKLSRLSEVIQMIEDNYVDSVDAMKLYESSINSMLKDLDPHSSYIAQEDVAANNEQLQGHFGGVGIRFIILRDTLMVTNVIDGGPSKKAGIQSGDRIIKVDDENIASKGIDIKQVHDKLKGSFGTPVKLTIIRNGKEIEYPIFRGDIPLPSVDVAYILEEDIGIIRITTFSSQTDKEFDQAISKLKNQGMKKVILDLRYNGGGYMHTAINVVDEFLKKGDLIVYTEGVNSPKAETFATTFGQCENMPVSVLINSGSASASEIVSGALQDNDRAIIIGRRSFGKGLVQRPFQLPDGSELRLTVSRYYTPTGRSIQKPYGEGIDYNSDLYDRYEKGEMQNIDSSIFEKAPKFITKGGKTVYGGGGIMPDIFVPIDTTGTSFYLTSLNYSEAYRNFSFDYLDKNRAKLNFKNEVAFNDNFIVSDELLNDFLKYAEKTEKIYRNESELNHSKEIIKNNLKAEIATYLFDTSARFLVNVPFDKEVQVAIEELKKM